MIEKGKPERLDVAWYRADNLVTTVISGAVTIKAGSRVIVDNAPVVLGIAGTSASYTLLPALTNDLDPNDQMLEIWTLRDGAFTEQVTFRRSGHLVITKLWPMITDHDLVARHSRLMELLPPSAVSWTEYRDLAWEVLNRDLIKRGRRPELILDSYALVDAHVYKSLELIFRDLTTLVGDGRYSELAMMYGEAYRSEWEMIHFRYDRDEDNAISAGENESATPSLWLGVPPGHPISWGVK